ncbi:hypothetical protein PEC301937_39230 [Pectobacterium carotovorum subsp. carotovorum]|nr:hypothetical protein PEC301937_39230 [Pectobacterium carotovorum subsp. carotovorum]
MHFQPEGNVKKIQTNSLYWYIQSCLHAVYLIGTIFFSFMTASINHAEE